MKVCTEITDKKEVEDSESIERLAFNLVRHWQKAGDGLICGKTSWMCMEK
jgi:hypothetical protein